jgi:hypothetical protein
MRSYLAGLFLLLASCDGDPAELSGASVKSQAEAKKAPAEDTSIMGGYFRFERPVQNLLVMRGKKAEGEKEAPPPLTGKHIGAAMDLVELSLQSQLTEAQKKQLLQALVAEYDAGGERREGILSAPLSWISMEQLYKKTRTPEERQDLIKKNKELFVLGVEASPNYLYKQVLQSIITANQTIAADGPPAMTQQHLFSHLEMLEFMIAVYLKRPFSFSAEDREAISTGITKAYQEMPTLTRDLFAKTERNPDVLWVLLRFQWMQMSEEERQAFRLSLIDVFGFPYFQGSMEDGAKALEMLPESSLSREMRKMVTPKLGKILQLVVEMPSMEEDMIGYLIYEY